MGCDYLLDMGTKLTNFLLVFLLTWVGLVYGVPMTMTRIVHTRSGKVQGFIQPATHAGIGTEGRGQPGAGTAHSLKPVEVFLGIPYATPPVRVNRFSPTRTPLPWDGVRIADKMGPVCPQKLPDISNETLALERMPKGRLEYLRRLQVYLQNQSEDCLYLNLYAPAQGKNIYIFLFV
jgi:neuroligin